MSYTQPKISYSGRVGVSIRFGMISTQGMPVFVARLWKLCMHGRISDPGVVTYGPIVSGCRWLHEPQPITDGPSGVEGSTPCEAVSTRGLPVFVRGCRNCKCIEGLLSGDGALSPPGPAGHRHCPGGQLSRRAGSMGSLTRNQPVALGFPHVAGWYKPGRCPFSSPSRWGCSFFQELMIRG